MGSTAILLALLAVAVFFIGLWVGFRHGHSGAQSKLDMALASERNLAEAREAGLREQLARAREEIAELKPKAEDLTRARSG
jgi:uncharacterized membrane protein